MKSIVIFGAGIAGLSAAHELMQLGYVVSVYEATDQPGGFFRSGRCDKTHMPTEYSWHGMGPWYHNTFDLMKKIPLSATAAGSLYDSALSRPIDFGIFPDDDSARFYDHRLKSIPKMFRMRGWDLLGWSYLMLKTWTANRRSRDKYGRFNAARSWRPFLREKAYRTWRACFGPWIGSDWSRASLHTAGAFFKKQLTTRPRHRHLPDDEGPAWTHGAGDGWLLLRGPSSEYWFNPWVTFLRENGVTFFWKKPLTRLEFDGARIVGAWSGEERIVGDAYVIAINPFSMADILKKTPALESLDVLRMFQPLTQDGPHAQVSFRLAFREAIHFPRKRMAVVVSDSEFNLTLFAEEQVWEKTVDLGRNVKSLWTGTACNSRVPGRIYRKPVEKCTKEEFVEEIKAQIFNCRALDELVREANGGRPLKSFADFDIEVWHEWEFSPEGIKHFQPKWVTSTTTQPHLPPQVTPVPNLFLAGAHTATQADVWSIEGAVESGRRAAKAIDARVPVLDQHRPGWAHFLSKLDDRLYALNAPHVIDVGLALAAAMTFFLLL